MSFLFPLNTLRANVNNEYSRCTVQRGAVRCTVSHAVQKCHKRKMSSMIKMDPVYMHPNKVVKWIEACISSWRMPKTIAQESLMQYAKQWCTNYNANSNIFLLSFGCYLYVFAAHFFSSSAFDKTWAQWKRMFDLTQFRGIQNMHISNVGHWKLFAIQMNNVVVHQCGITGFQLCWQT